MEYIPVCLRPDVQSIEAKHCYLKHLTWVKNLARYSNKQGGSVMRIWWLFLVSLCLDTVSFGGSAAALDFDFRATPGMNAEAIKAFRRAGKLWSDALSDDITVVIDIDFKKLDNGVLGSTNSVRTLRDYKEFRTALIGSMSADEKLTVESHVPQGDLTKLLTNHMKKDAQTPASAVPFLDDDGDENNQKMRLTRANAKALGLLAKDATDADASIAFSTEFNWDFEPDNGVQVNHFSFVAVAAHEIGHALGFTSGVDILDGNTGKHGTSGPHEDKLFTFVSAVDVFRRSTKSKEAGATAIDWTADKRDKHFALRSPDNSSGGFSTGRRHGDKQQASHWKDELSLGLMDPTIAHGVHISLSELDLALFEAIGYERILHLAQSGASASAELSNARAGLVIQASSVSSPDGNTILTYSDAANAPIIELRREGGIVENPDTEPFLRIFGDGMVRVHYPAYMKKAGEYEFKLSPSELKDLLSQFSSSSVAEAPTLDLDEQIRASPESGLTIDDGTHGVENRLKLNLREIEHRVDNVRTTISNAQREISITAEKLSSTSDSSSRDVRRLGEGIIRLKNLGEDSRLQRIE